MRHTTIDLGPGETVDLDIGPCDCSVGQVCAADDPFAAGCPRRGPVLLLRGGPVMPLYLRKLEPDVGVTSWTHERPRAHRFADRRQAALVQSQIVSRSSFAIAVVPA